jgi:hypothetical protein
MRNGARSFMGFAVALAAALVCGPAAAQTATPAASAATAPGATCCTRPQSPRSLTDADWDYTSSVSTVQQDGDSITYEPRAGVKKTLHRCSQHYHCHVENVQSCNKASAAAPAAGESACPAKPPVGSWVEIHTAYHDAPAVIPTPQNLGSCDLKTVVVVGYHAKVTLNPAPSPPPSHFGPPAAEWTGSSTGPDVPPLPECKVAAFWHFALGCDFKVGEGQLAKFDHPDEARGLQPADRLSKDLTHIVVPKKHPTKPQ